MVHRVFYCLMNCVEWNLQLQYSCQWSKVVCWHGLCINKNCAIYSLAYNVPTFKAYILQLQESCQRKNFVHWPKAFQNCVDNLNIDKHG